MYFFSVVIHHFYTQLNGKQNTSSIYSYLGKHGYVCGVVAISSLLFLQGNTPISRDNVTNKQSAKRPLSSLLFLQGNTPISRENVTNKQSAKTSAF